VSGLEFAVFGQDRWRLNDRVMFELGLRVDRDDIVETVNFSPRGGASISVLPEGRGILRGGVGKFDQRTPLDQGAFTQYQTQTVTRYDPLGQMLAPPVTFQHVLGLLKTPESLVRTIA
jgi:outer membrane receptor protein involved in Fe transport